MTLERDEMIEILEGIAREGSNTAQIQAIKVLLSIQEGTGPSDDDLERLIQTK